MKSLAAVAALLLAVSAAALPAAARDSYVIDNAHLLAPSTISQINAKVGDFYAQTHKEVVVDIEPALTGTPQSAAESIFAQQQINGVLILIAQRPKTIGVVPGRAAAQYFPAGSTGAIRQAIANAFNAGEYDAGVTSGVDLTLAEYRSHLGALRTTPAFGTAPVTVRNQTGGGFNMSLIFWLIALAVIFFVIRGIFRAMSGPRMYPPGYGGGPTGGPMGGGYGPGYGGGGFGGGGFFSGMLGGLGGAFLGNELFGNRGGGEFMNQNPGNVAGMGGGVPGADASGWQSDPGQADMGNSSFGGWGDSGGGDSGGGWGGGGGGDFGGGGDSGGGGW